MIAYPERLVEGVIYDGSEKAAGHEKDKEDIIPVGHLHAWLVSVAMEENCDHVHSLCWNQCDYGNKGIHG